MHATDRLALLTLIVGIGSFAGSVISLGVVRDTRLTIILLGLGVAGQTASQLLRIYGSPSTTQTKGN